MKNSFYSNNFTIDTRTWLRGLFLFSVLAFWIKMLTTYLDGVWKPRNRSWSILLLWQVNSVGTQWYIYKNIFVKIIVLENNPFQPSKMKNVETFFNDEILFKSCILMFILWILEYFQKILQFLAVYVFCFGCFRLEVIFFPTP